MFNRLTQIYKVLDKFAVANTIFKVCK